MLIPVKARARTVDFHVYDEALFDGTYLKSLGPLGMPKQGSRAGLDGRTPAQIEQDIERAHNQKEPP